MAKVFRLVPLLLFAAASVLATEREGRLALDFGRKLPAADEKPGPDTLPLLVYVVTDRESRDQERFDEVVLKNESMLLAAKFFRAVEIDEETAKEHPLFANLTFSAPCVVAFDAKREKHAVAGGRASGMKVYSTLVNIGQRDYENKLGKTVREARNLLATFDQIDAARDALGIKRDRIGEARDEGNAKKAAQLERQVEAEENRISTWYEKTEARWQRIWDLKRKS